MSRARDIADGKFSGDLEADSPTFVVDAENNRVGVGTAAPSDQLTVVAAAGGIGYALVGRAADGYGRLQSYDRSGTVGTGSLAFFEDGTISFNRSNTGSLVENARIDTSGNLLVGKTAEGANDIGFQARPDGFFSGTRNNSTVAYLQRQTGDGEILRFQRDSSTVGSIGANGGYFYLSQSNTGILLDYGDSLAPSDGSGAIADNQKDVGHPANRWDDVYATNGTIQTSDRNEKQDIEELDEAERRVAVAAKGLLRKFRWKDAVEEKGDDARIHFGIIAQDLQAAFEAEGLDAGRYAMFISSTWWEADEVTPAVDEVLDDDGNVVTEAQPERTVTNTYQTAEEAPEGAVERTRMGIRYPQLLAFIIGAM